jgi:hypothetical protein
MAISTSYPTAPAKASGITLTGNRIAAIAGPFLFAQVMTHASYATAWVAEAGSAVAAAITMFVGDQLIKRREFHGRGT